MLAYSGSIYVFGWLDSSWDKKDFWRFDPHTNSWTSLPDAPYPAYAAAADVVEGKMYVFWWSVSMANQNRFFFYDFDSWKWGGLPDWPISVRYYALSSSGNSLYCVWGYVWTKIVSDIWRFDTVSREWELFSHSPLPIYTHKTFVHRNSLYLLWGQDTQSNTRNFWRMDIDTKTWTKLSDIPFNPFRKWSLSFHDGIAYVLGWYNEEDGFLRQGWSYDTRSSAWHSMGFEFDPRYGHASAVTDGFVFLFWWADNSGYYWDILKWEIPKTDRAAF